MENLDLDINNYDLDDILSLFNISYNYDSNDIKNCRETMLKLHPYKCNLNSNYFDFYSLAYKIIECLHYYREQRLFVDVKYYPDYSEDNNFINQIKQVPNFGKYEDSKILIDKINNKDNNEIIYEKMKQDREKLESLDEKKELLIKTSNNNYNDTYPNEIVSGSINTIKRITQFKNLHLNSCFRHKYHSTSTSNFDLHLPNEIKNAISLKLASIEIPNSWYLFSNTKKNNIIKITINIGDLNNRNKITEYNETVIIPEGNYDNDLLEDYLNSTYFYETEKETPLKYLKFEIDNTSLKTVIKVHDQNDTPFNFSFSLNFSDDTTDNYMNTAGWILGFRQKKYLNVTDSIQSEGLYDGGGDRYVYFCIDDYQYNRNESNIICFDQNTLDKSVLAKIPMINGKLSLVVEQNLSDSLIKTRRYNGPVNIKKLNVRLIDKFGDYIDLNSMDFSFTLEIELLYERNGVV